ncbi:solute carrier organic anion transporter family member 5A1-like [Saccoglossus kowalevskii]|uniref:Solute carrier organic anion transporter family member n=1 Tax=Saccoglossus kowalevskii TaxID=10224 RepID=A0ABM0LW05_SACKO|nr:PREDICTED: solute carrier organic anion transporter family member 5A1-like [Saccoglossus kowalevskii]
MDMESNSHANIPTGTEQSLLDDMPVNVVSALSITDQYDYSCGIRTWRPRCLQAFAKAQFAVAGLVIATLCVTLNFAAMSSALNNWEKRYSLPSTIVSLAFTVMDVAMLLPLILITYIGGRPDTHRPRWIGSGMVIGGIGLLTVSTLQFMSGPYQYGVIREKKSFDLCSAQKDYSFNETKGCSEETIHGEQLKLLVLILTGIIMFGIGISPLFTLGITYIDDNVPKNKAPFYIGAMISMYALGPIIAFPVSSAYNNMYVDFYRVNTSTIDISRYDPRWVGAWWLAFVINGPLCIIVGLSIMLLPKKIHAKVEISGSPNQEVIENNTVVPILNKKLKDLPQALKRLMYNKTYMAVMIARTVDIAVIAALMPFSVKFIHDQLRVTMSIAGTLVPVAFIIPSGLGIFVGGILMRKFKPSLLTTARNVLLVAVLVVPLPIIMIFIGCDNYRFAGINTEYAVRLYGNSSNVNSVTSCNSECLCKDDVFDPVCGSDGITYLSPCHAGCQSLDSPMSRAKNFTECACTGATIKDMPSRISSAPTSNHSLMANNNYAETYNNTINNGSAYLLNEDDISILGYARTGICGEECNQIVIVFVVVFFIFGFIGSLPTTMTMEILLRCVDPAEKTFALGVQDVFTQLLVWIPTPVFIGATIDSTCVLWETTACGDEGACWLYDIPQYRMKYMLVLLAIKVVSLIFKALIWWMIKNRVNGDKNYDNVPTNKSENETHL